MVLSPYRLCLRNAEGYQQRLSELVLRGMASEVLSCRISSTAVCVEVWLRVGEGGWRAGVQEGGGRSPGLSWGPISGRCPGLRRT